MKRCLLVLLATCILAPAAWAAPRPNIIYILADDLGYGDLACYRVAAPDASRALETPHLDRLAAEGIRFTRHYAGNTVCAPSRAVLMTGLHSGHVSIRGNGPGALADSVPTVARLLKGGGYHTACIGKWGVGSGLPLDDPQRKGFDRFFGYISMHHAHNFFPEFLVRDGAKEALPNKLYPEWKEKGRDGAGIAEVQEVFAPHLLQEEVLSYIGEEAKTAAPFFLYYALNIPHANNEGGRMPPRGMEVPPGPDGQPDYGPFAGMDWPDPEKGFAQYITFIDNYVGEIMESLERQGLEESTLVLFSSDNGPHNEGGHDHRFFDSNGAFSGYKRSLTDGGIREPFIARWKGTIEAGRTSDHLSGFQDILPTVCELAGVTAPANDGISLVPTLLGAGEQREHDHLYFEFHRGRGKSEVAVIQGTWKFITPYKDGTISPHGRLHKLSKDPAESQDLSGTFPKKAAELFAIAQQEHTPVADPRPWTTLFDGTSLASWTRGDGKPLQDGGWTITGDALHRKASGGGSIYTRDEYGDFELELEWKISPKGNSGIKYRMARYGKNWLGPEYQVLDDGGHPDGKNGLKRTTAALYDLLPANPERKKLKPVGAWNHTRIVARGRRFQHYLNGSLVVDVTVGSDRWKAAVAESKFKKVAGFAENPRGRIMLQDHGDEVWYRHIRIRDL
ncbi:MAG: sulfatase-like hydrolase/transferase [Akkermansiaceae bacterium]|nr:sulfatase-like hydrolase/transferase [Akkermansiaceae bacterium]